MDVKIVEIESGKLLNAKIVLKQKLNFHLPSIADGWRFNFNKHSKKINHQTFVLYCADTPETIEGCLIFEMRNYVEPYRAYVEVAPHNRGPKKIRGNVAGCLIAFACRLSFIHGQGDYLGWLAFEVLEESQEDEIKLMAVYSSKYNALRFGDTTTMVIPPEGGEKLINEFLNS
ncbi:MAG: hypothetical protein ACJA08_003096 [Cyclobacteriaceae bacterium]|jgi:hypothetical protein